MTNDKLWIRELSNHIDKISAICERKKLEMILVVGEADSDNVYFRRQTFEDSYMERLWFMMHSD